jgi:hypothetical protein
MTDFQKDNEAKIHPMATANMKGKDQSLDRMHISVRTLLQALLPLTPALLSAER